jgi:ubiquinone/menaquinone biosynthesis C-methylase UbiE
MKIKSVYIKNTKYDGKIISYDKKKIPSWIQLQPHKRIAMIKIEHNNQKRTYLKYFEDYYLILNAGPKDYQSYYDAIVNKYESMCPQNKKLALFLYNKLKKYLPKDKHILEISAGTGNLTEKLIKYWSNLTITDISSKCLDVNIRKTKISKEKVIVSDIFKLNLNKKFDAIVELTGLDYFTSEQMKLISNRITTHLKKKGIFMCVDMHPYPEIEEKFKVIEKGKFKRKAPIKEVDYYYFIGEKK